jgi:hypothetical protein
MSDIKFSNLIFEEGKDVIAQATNPSFQDYQRKLGLPGTNLNKLVDYSKADTKLDTLQKSEVRENVANKKIQYYIGKINSPGTNLISLELSINLEPNLTDVEKSNLYRMVSDKRKNPDRIVDYNTYFNTFSTPPAPDYTNTKEYVDSLGLNRPNVYQSGLAQTSSIGGTTGTAGTGTTLIIDPESGTAITPEEFAKLQLESHYAGGVEKDPSIKTRGMKPSTESIGMEQEQSLASLETQYKEIQKKINLLDKVYAEIVRNPTNLNLGNILNAHSSNKFVKLAEKELIEADQENIDYEGDYYQDLYDQSVDKPQYGPAIKNPGKWRKVPTTKIPD